MSSISRLVESTSRDHEPVAAGTEARCMILPSLPTTRLTRSISLVVLSLNSMMSLNVSAIFPASPVHSPGRRTEKSPRLKATRAFKSSFVFRDSLVEVWVRIISFRIVCDWREDGAKIGHIVGFETQTHNGATSTRPCCLKNKELY